MRDPTIPLLMRDPTNPDPLGLGRGSHLHPYQPGSALGPSASTGASTRPTSAHNNYLSAAVETQLAAQEATWTREDLDEYSLHRASDELQQNRLAQLVEENTRREAQLEQLLEQEGGQDVTNLLAEMETTETEIATLNTQIETQETQRRAQRRERGQRREEIRRNIRDGNGV